MRFENRDVKHTNKVKVLSARLMVAYSDLGGTRNNYLDSVPANAGETIASYWRKAASDATRIMRHALLEIDRVVIARQKEKEPFTSIVNYHFGLSQARGPQDNVVDKPFALKDINKKDRRYVLNEIRKGLLSISFHLNTGMYVIDIDAGNRAIVTGADRTNDPHPAWQDFMAGLPGTKGYVSGTKKGIFSGLLNGEIHMALEKFLVDGYSHEAAAKTIIHEAAHKYWAVADQSYAHNVAKYSGLSWSDALDNADSYAWTAVCFARKQLSWGDPNSQLQVIAQAPGVSYA